MMKLKLICNAVIAVSAVFFCLSCEETQFLSGAWKTADPSETGQIESLNSYYIRTVLGHFGPDVAGVVTFYIDSTYTIKASDGRCTCAYIKDGKYSGGVLTFSIESPSSCAGNKEPEISARFEYKSHGSLSGDLQDDAGENILTGVFTQKKDDNDLVRKITLVRDVNMEDITSEDKKCKN
jgi:hypothetical protein